MEHSKFQKLENRLITGLFLGMIVFVSFMFWGDFKNVKNTVVEIGFNWFFLAVLLTLLSYFLRFFKWNYYLKYVNISLSLKDSFNIFFTGMAMSITPGKIGEILKAYLLKKHANADFFKSTSVVVTERLTDFFAVIILIGLGVSVFSKGLYFFLFVSLSVLLFIFVIQSTKISYFFINLFTKIRFLYKHREKIITFYETLHELCHFKPLILSTFLSVIAWLLECFSLAVFIHALGLNFSLVHSIFVFSLGTLVGGVSMLPGGLGVAEASFTGMLLYFGINKSMAVSITLLIRMVTLWLGVWLGLIVFFLTRKKYLN